MDSTIIARCEAAGIDRARLQEALDSKDNWRDMVHAFEFLTVLGIVADAMRESSDNTRLA